jgi:hypothetical protein
MLLVKNGEPAMARSLPLALHIDIGDLPAVNAAAGTANMASENAVENFIVYMDVVLPSRGFNFIFRRMVDDGGSVIEYRDRCE